MAQRVVLYVLGIVGGAGARQCAIANLGQIDAQLSRIINQIQEFLKDEHEQDVRSILVTLSRVQLLYRPLLNKRQVTARALSQMVRVLVKPATSSHLAAGGALLLGIARPVTTNIYIHRCILVTLFSHPKKVRNFVIIADFACPALHIVCFCPKPRQRLHRGNFACYLQSTGPVAKWQGAWLRTKRLQVRSLPGSRLFFGHFFVTSLCEALFLV